MTPLARTGRAAVPVIGLLAAVASLSAQNPSVLVVRGATVHTLAGPAIENGTVVIEGGRITAVGASVPIPAGATVIDAATLHVYPGMVDAATQLGLTEIGQVEVTNDMSELGDFNPQLNAATAVHPASEHIPVARANGITHAVSMPESPSGGIGGQATLVNLDGWTIEEMQVVPSVGMVMSWPTLRVGGSGYEFFRRGPPPARTFAEAEERYREGLRKIEGWLEEARRYDASVKAGEPTRRDLKLEALARVTNRELPMLVTADRARDIRNAVEFMEGQGLRMILLSGEEAWKVRDFLAEKDIPVITGLTQALPSGDDEGYDERYAAPGLLVQAGVKIAFGTFGSSDSRTLPYEAANAVSYGLAREEALKAVTVNAAEILGVGSQLGTIEVGKRANLIVTTGDPLEIQTVVGHVIIDGRDVSLANRHQELYERYRARPRPGGS